MTFNTQNPRSVCFPSLGVSAEPFLQTVMEAPGLWTSYTTHTRLQHLGYL